MKNNSSYAVVIIKPDAHRDVLAGMIVEDFEEEGFRDVILVSLNSIFEG